MNVFVLCTGRCGSLTFIKACQHITNYTSAHESRSGDIGNSRFAYSPDHIEADNRLSWVLGGLEKTYGDDAIYIHLKRSTSDTARSFLKRWNSGIIMAYHTGILMNPNQREMSDDDKLSVCMDYCRTVNSNIEIFLKNKTKTMNFSLENARNDFQKFWGMISAEGDYQKALSEWDISYNASKKDPLGKTISPVAVNPVSTPVEQCQFIGGQIMNQGETQHSEDAIKLTQLCTLVESLSIHQRQLSSKIEELQSHHEQLYLQQNHIYSQVDALFSIFSIVSIRHPLPTMRGWPVSPDFVKELMSLIIELKPDVIVEAGSGVSTIISSYCLEKNGHGKIISMDHDGDYAAKTVKDIKLHGLDSIATVHHCPLSGIGLDGEPFQWYLPPEEIQSGTIDLLVIDGPPSSIGPLARYPALPVFYEQLAGDAVIILDDAARDSEKKVVDRWLDTYDEFDYTYLDTEKGTVVLRRKNTVSNIVR